MKVKRIYCKSPTQISCLWCAQYVYQSGCKCKRYQINKWLPFKIMLSDIDIPLWTVRPRSKEGLIKLSQLDLKSVSDIQSQSKCWLSFRSRTWLKTREIWKTLFDKVSRHEQSTTWNSSSEIWRLAAQSPVKSRLRNYCLSNEQFSFLLTSTRQDRFTRGHESKRLASARRAPPKNGSFI